jgi:hypothetical protein
MLVLTKQTVWIKPRLNIGKRKSKSSRIWEIISESICDICVDNTVVTLAEDITASPVKNLENTDRLSGLKKS